MGGGFGALSANATKTLGSTRMGKTKWPSDWATLVEIGRVVSTLAKFPKCPANKEGGGPKAKGKQSQVLRINAQQPSRL